MGVCRSIEDTAAQGWRRCLKRGNLWIGSWRMNRNYQRKERRKCSRQMVLHEQRHGSIYWGFVVRISVCFLKYWDAWGIVAWVCTGRHKLLLWGTFYSTVWTFLVGKRDWAGLSIEEEDWWQCGEWGGAGVRAVAGRQVGECCCDSGVMSSGSSSYNGRKGCLLWEKVFIQIHSIW